MAHLELDEKRIGLPIVLFNITEVEQTNVGN